MTLKDPPSYVGLDPALIYGVHDLKRETYQRLLQLIGWMWVTRKTGSPLGTSIQELAGRWDIAERTVYHTLQTLADKDYIAVEYTDSRAYIMKGPRCQTYNNTPGEPDTTTQQQQAARGGNRASRASCLHETGGSRATRLHGPTNSSVVVVVSDDPDCGQPQQQTTTGAAQTAMEAAGMFPDKAAELAADPWVTEQRIGAWLDRLQADPSIRNLPAVLYSNLKHHREAPAQRQARDSRRFIEGDFADYVQH